jgi:hypothetical protein
VWKPVNNLEWQRNALCALPENRTYIDHFFSQDFSQKYTAKNLCFSCPVRSQCLQWALEHRQIWGIWGGKDEVEIRRTLSVSYLGEETRRRRFPNCPYCTARPNKLETSVAQLDTTGRWTTAKIVTCTFGSVLDVIVDLRPESHSFGSHIQIRLSALEGKSIYISKGLGHAFQSLEDNSTISYLLDKEYNPEEEFGITPLDSNLNIPWNKSGLTISKKDTDAPTMEAFFEARNNS